MKSAGKVKALATVPSTDPAILSTSIVGPKLTLRKIPGIKIKIKIEIDQGSH